VFDLITIDPPPPDRDGGFQPALCQEFYTLIKAHLRPNGISPTVVPRRPRRGMQAIAPVAGRFVSLCEGLWIVERVGLSFFGVDAPIDVPSADVCLARLPTGARRDLLEWNRGSTKRLHAPTDRERDPLADLLADNRGWRSVTTGLLMSIIYCVDLGPTTKVFLRRILWLM